MKKVYTNEDFEKAFKKEKKIKYTAYKKNAKLLGINVILAIVFAYAFTANPDSDWFEMLGWVITCFAFAATLLGIVIVPQYSVGGSTLLVLMQLALFIVGMLPWYFNCATVWNFGWVKAIWMTPLTLLVIVLYGGFCSLKPAGVSSGDSLTINDMSVIRRTQRLAGLDPNRVPPTLVSAKTAKRMSVTDWNALGYDLTLAGYDVFRSNRR